MLQILGPKSQQQVLSAPRQLSKVCALLQLCFSSQLRVTYRYQQLLSFLFLLASTGCVIVSILYYLLSHSEFRFKGCQSRSRSFFQRHYKTRLYVFYSQEGQSLRALHIRRYIARMVVFQLCEISIWYRQQKEEDYQSKWALLRTLYAILVS